MSEVPLQVATFVLLMGFAASFFRSVAVGKVGVPLGMMFGALYFTLIPIGALVFAGEYELPKEFSNMRLPRYVSFREYETEIATVLWCSVGLLLWSLAKASEPTNRPQVPLARESSIVLLVGFGAYFFLQACFLVATGLLSQGGHWANTRGEFLAETGLVGAITVQGIFATRIVVLCELLSLLFQRRYSLIRFLVTTGGFGIIDLYLTGNRIFLLQAIVGLVVVLLVQRRLIALAVLGVMAIPFGVAMNLFRYFRAYMHYADFGTSADLAFTFAERYSDDAGVIDFLFGITESINLFVLLELIRLIPDREEYLWGTTLMRWLFAPIPRSVWPDKPEGITVIAGSHFAPDTNISLAVTLFGEVYANFGPIGAVIVCPLIGGLLCLLVAKLFGDSLRAQFLGLMLGFTVMRMAVSDMVLTLALAFATTAIADLLSRHTGPAPAASTVGAPPPAKLT